MSIVLSGEKSFFVACILFTVNYIVLAVIGGHFWLLVVLMTIVYLLCCIMIKYILFIRLLIKEYV